MVVVGDVREMAVVRDEGTVGVAVPVEKGRLVESVVESRESECQQCMILSFSQASSC